MPLKETPPTGGDPLEWWEEIQIDLLERIGFIEEARRFREHPDEWRRLRAKLRSLPSIPPRGE